MHSTSAEANYDVTFDGNRNHTFPTSKERKTEIINIPYNVIVQRTLNIIHGPNSGPKACSFCETSTHTQPLLLKSKCM
jgi:hypothetical protein